MDSSSFGNRSSTLIFSQPFKILKLYYYYYNYLAIVTQTLKIKAKKDRCQTAVSKKNLVKTEAKAIGNPRK